jgi:hypothetical protein
VTEEVGVPNPASSAPGSGGITPGVGGAGPAAPAGALSEPIAPHLLCGGEPRV